LVQVGHQLLMVSEQFVIIFVVGTASISASACVYLLVRLWCGLSKTSRKRLFPLQLQFLTGADLFFLLCKFPTDLVNVGLLHGLSSSSLDDICKWGVGGLEFGRKYSLWIEVHIALSFVVLSFKIRSVACLHTTLLLLIVPCLVVSLLYFTQQPWHYDRSKKTCQPVVWTTFSVDPMALANIAGCFLGMEIVCLFPRVRLLQCPSRFCSVSTETLKAGRGDIKIRNHVRRLPFSVKASASRRGEAYMINALVTYTPTLMMYTIKGLRNNEDYCRIAGAIENLGGAFNTIAYAWGSRYGRAIQAGDTTRFHSERRPSYHVDIAPVGPSTLEFTSSFVSSCRSAGESALLQ